MLSTWQTNTLPKPNWKTMKSGESVTSNPCQHYPHICYCLCVTSFAPRPGVRESPAVLQRLYPSASPSYDQNTEILPSDQEPQITTYISWRVYRKGKVDVPFTFWHIGILQVGDKDAGFSGSFFWPWEMQKTHQPHTITGWKYLYVAQEGGLSCLWVTLTCWPSSRR